MNDLRSHTIDDSVEIRCITDCHVTGEVIDDKVNKQKRVTLHCDNIDNNEVVILFNSKNLNSVPYSLPSDIFYHNIPEPGSTNQKATVKIKKEWIPVLSKIVAGYNFEKIQDQAKLLSVVPNVFA